MSVKLLTEHNLEFLSLKGGGTGSSESTLVKMPHCWKSHVTAQLRHIVFVLFFLFQTRKETHVPDSPFIRMWPTRQTVRSIISVWDQPSQRRGVLGVISPLECPDIVSSPTHSQSVLENRSRHDPCVNRPIALSSNPKDSWCCLDS